MKTNIFITIVFALTIFTRFYKLGDIPNSYTPDELSQGYTAYSLLLTGKDEWGVSWPLRPKSYGDYKPPLQTYLLIPSIKYFGLTPYAVRFPNALMSVLGVVGFFFLLKKYTSKEIAVLGTLLYSLSPPILGMGRIALEANIMLTLIVWGVYFTLSSSLFFSIISGLLLGASLFTYHSSKVFIPLFIAVSFFKQKNKVNLALTASIVIILFTLNMISELHGASQRATDIIITSPTDNWEHVDKFRYESVANGGKVMLSELFENKSIYTIDTVGRNIASYFSPQYLLSEGAGEGTYGVLGGFGILGPSMFLGLIMYLLCWHKNYNKKILVLCFLGILPAAMTKGHLAANRAIIAIPFFFIAGSIGLEILFKKVNKPPVVVTLLLTLFFVSKFVYTYFTLSNFLLAKDMLYGHKQINDYISTLPQNDIQVVYSRSLSEPQAYAMFFNKTDPRIIQKASVQWSSVMQKTGAKFLDQVGEYSFANFIFKEIRNEDFTRENTLIIGKEGEFAGKKPTNIIKYPEILNPRTAIYMLFLGNHSE